MISNTQPNRYIFTGTPGSGKTSVIQELKKLQHVIIPEAATDLIAKEQITGNLCPWKHSNFIDNIIEIQKMRQISAKGELQFYDRSPFCTYALAHYLAKLNNKDFVPSLNLLNEIDRCIKNSVYHDKIFFFENLGFIENTNARKISYEEALIFEEIHLDIYKKFNFEIVFVPKNSIQARCEFILSSSTPNRIIT